MNYFNITSVVVLSLLLHDLIDGSLDIKPVIDTKYEEIIKDAGDNFTVICLGHAPLEWVPPEIPEEYQDLTKIIVNDIQSPKKDYLYAKQLVLQNLTFPFVGYYKCRVQGLREQDNERTLSKIYLFIRDEEQLSVDNGEIQLLYAVQYKTVTIPCRPTSPDVDVELTRSYGEKQTKIVNNVPVDGIIYRYDPHYGFLTNDTEAVGEKILICKYQRGGKVTSTPYVLATELLVVTISRPVIEEISGGHTVVGQQLKLICKVNCSARVTIEWVTPTGPPDPNRMNVSLLMNPLELGTYMQNLTINEARLEDKGVYYCKVTAQDRTSSNSINVTIFDVDEHFIELMEENDIYEISETITNDTKPISWRVLVKGHPEPKLFWLNNRNQTIPNGETRKYIVNNQIKNEAVLTIKNITISDYGNYTLIAKNDYETKHASLFLNLTDKPSVHIESDEFLFINKPTLIKCVAIAHPKPQIFWHYKPCRHNNCTFVRMKESYSKLEDLQLTSFLTLKINQTGVVKCSANNSLGGDEAIRQIHVSDVENGLDIFGIPDSVVFDERKNQMIVARNDYFKMVCGASIENYTDGIQWYYNNKPIKANDDYNLHNSRTLYSYRVLLEINSMQKHNDGVYSCRIRTRQGDWINENVTIIVAEPTIPFINNTNLMKDIETVWPKPLDLFCIVTGIPRPSIIWYKSGEVFNLPSNGRIKSIDRNQRLHFSYTEPTDEGNYKCEAANRIGRTSRQINLKISNKTADYSGLLIGLSLFFGILLFASVLFIIRKIRIERKLQKELQIAGLAHFERGAIENLNPDLAVDDQAELLPYDKKWEFPIEKLKLGKQLGSGAFGVVLKGEAYGIVPGEDKTTVAVKMCKKNADYTYIKALASELKIMVHLGKHLNVVNLLGACTKNVAKRELLVIVEFCRFGNLHNYLLRHRDNFIDQVDPKTGQIDFQIGQELLERTYSVSSNKSNPQSPNLKYAALSFSNNSNNIPTAMADYRGKNYSGVTAVTDTTLVTSSGAIGSEGMVISNNSVQPEWRSNYHGDYNKGIVRPICTKDLLTWTFQVSRGMEYLASRKVLHGDLAARNILLGDNNVVKICDFGLAKSMYKSNDYKKRGDGPLPVKWMAIESIRDRVFSTQSDVWSFGIVLWEFFSLARTPYPGMEPDEHLYNKLLDGYRMESPQYAPKEVYKMMLDCWRAKPTQRPTFTNLAERIGSMLEDSVRKHYIDLNDPYLMINTQRIENGENDYLAMLSPPDYDKFSQPQPHDYVNDIQVTDNGSDGYLCMKPVEIFSPRPDDGRIFDFNDVKNNKKNPTENGNLTEMVPMLRQTSTTDSDNESACNSPSSFSNPSYHLPPIVERSDKDIVKGSDNYVNMPENKIKQEKKISTKIDNEKQHHYMNNNSRDWERVKV